MLTLRQGLTQKKLPGLFLIISLTNLFAFCILTLKAISSPGKGHKSLFSEPIYLKGGKTMNHKRNYVFTLYLNGDGYTPEEAWNDAVESLLMDPDQLNEMPMTYKPGEKIEE